MMASTSAEQVRVALAKYRERVPHGRFPDDLRKQAMAYVRGRLGERAGFAAIAVELGVSETATRTWAKEAARPTKAAPRGASSAEASMLPLLIRSAPEAAGGARLDVSFPDGTKVQASGMSGREMVDAITALRGSR